MTFRTLGTLHQNRCDLDASEDRKIGTSNTGLSPSTTCFLKMVCCPLGCTVALQYQESMKLAACTPVALGHFFLEGLWAEALSRPCGALELGCLLLSSVVLLAKPGVNHPSSLVDSQSRPCR